MNYVKNVFMMLGLLGLSVSSFVCNAAEERKAEEEGKEQKLAAAKGELDRASAEFVQLIRLGQMNDDELKILQAKLDTVSAEIKAANEAAGILYPDPNYREDPILGRMYVSPGLNAQQVYGMPVDPKNVKYPFNVVED